jgi:hypothetical protein
MKVGVQTTFKILPLQKTGAPFSIEIEGLDKNI